MSSMDEVASRITAEVAVDWARYQHDWAEVNNPAEAEVMVAIQSTASADGLEIVGSIDIDWVQRYQVAGRTVEYTWDPVAGEPDHWRPGFQLVCKGTALAA
jgi:hypothetical protein